MGRQILVYINNHNVYTFIRKYSDIELIPLSGEDCTPLEHYREELKHYLGDLNDEKIDLCVISDTILKHDSFCDIDRLSAKTVWNFESINTLVERNACFNDGRMNLQKILIGTMKCIDRSYIVKYNNDGIGIDYYLYLTSYAEWSHEADLSNSVSKNTFPQKNIQTILYDYSKR